MSPAHVLEPTYEALKRRLKDGRWPGGMRLESAKLAEEFGVSITPVRDSLNRLFGERMVDFAPGEGFRVLQLDEKLFRELLGLNSILLTAAADSRRSKRYESSSIPSDIPESTADIFGHIAGRSGNASLVRSVISINDRLHSARIVELEIFGDVEREITDLRKALNEASTNRALQALLHRYHERRVDAASEIMQLLADQQCLP